MRARTCQLVASGNRTVPADRRETGAWSNPMEGGEGDGLVEGVEGFCRGLRPIEEQCYLERRFNDRVVPLAREHGLLGMPVPVVYGGRGADMVTYARALVRIGREG